MSESNHHLLEGAAAANLGRRTHSFGLVSLLLHLFFFFVVSFSLNKESRVIGQKLKGVLGPLSVNLSAIDLTPVVTPPSFAERPKKKTKKAVSKKVKELKKKVPLKPQTPSVSTKKTIQASAKLALQGFNDLVTNYIKPSYPRKALRRRWEGRVKLRVLIGPSGQVADVSVIKTSGFEILDRSAVKAAKRWSFKTSNEQQRILEKVIAFELRKR